MRPIVALTLLVLIACRDEVAGPFDDFSPDSAGDDSAPSDDSGDDSAVPTSAGSVSGLATTLLDDPDLVSFTVPFARGAIEDLSTLRLDVADNNVPFQAGELYRWWDAEASSEGVRVALVQFEASWMTTDSASVTVRWGGDGDGEAPGADLVDPSDERVSATVDETANLTDRTILEVDGAATLVETETWTSSLYTASQPRVLVVLDPSAWIGSGAFGATPAVADWEGLGLGALAPLGQGLSDYSRSAALLQAYGLNEAGVRDPTDPLQWEFGRCTAFLDAAILTDDAELLAEGHRMCSWYVGEANLWAASLGFWTLNDPVSGLLFHGRDLFDFGMVSGSNEAIQTNARVATIWYDSDFVSDYQGGRVDGEVWTEQILGTALEGLWYGYLASGDPELLDATEQLIATLHTHTTGDDAALAAMGLAFPAQGCLVHSEAQSGEGEDPARPWCSPWQTATLLDPMLQYRELTGDTRVDEILVAFGRFLRDRGTSYALEELTYCDSFLEPLTCYETPVDDADPRMLSPLYGAGLNAEGEVIRSPMDGDFAHCPDVSALAAASWMALRRRPDLDAGPTGPFASETASFEALYHELGACAAWTLAYYHRPKRNPAYWTAEALAAGLADPDTFIASYKIGYPDYATDTLRQSAWWFNAGLLAAPELAAGGVSVEEYTVGWVQPAECADPAVSACP